MSAPLKKEHLETVQSTLQVHFTGVLCGELARSQHSVLIKLPKIMFDVSDIALAQYTLFVISAGKMYSGVDNLHIDEDAYVLRPKEVLITSRQTP